MRRAISILVVSTLAAVVFFPPVPALFASGDNGMQSALQTHDPEGIDHLCPGVDLRNNDLHPPDAAASGAADPAQRFLPAPTGRQHLVTSRFTGVLRL